MASVAGDARNSSAWQRLRRRVVAESGGICWICGHDGAGEADHVIPIEDGGPALDPANVRAAHGSSSRCPTCGRCCNQSRRRSGNGNGRPPQPDQRADLAVTGWDTGCQFAGVQVRAGDWGTSGGQPRPLIDFVHDPDCRQNHSMPW